MSDVVKLTGETITDAAIADFRTEVRKANAEQGAELLRLANVEWLDDLEMLCNVALNPPAGRHYLDARARIAEIINARNGASS